jgi:hypothetical protein
MVLTKAQILGAKDLDSEIVHMPEWGGDVKVRMMTGTERDAFEASIFEVKGTDTKQNMVNLRAKLVGRVLIDDDGARLFTDKEIEELGKKSARSLDKIFKVAQRLNGIGGDAVEELTKN